MTEVSVHPSRKSKPGLFLDWQDDQGNTFHGIYQEAIIHFVDIHPHSRVMVYAEPDSPKSS